METISKESITGLYKRKSKGFLGKTIETKWIILKLVIFASLFLLALVLKLLRQIVRSFLNCMDYLTNLGIDDIDGKIVRLFESVKRTGREFLKISFKEKDLSEK